MQIDIKQFEADYLRISGKTYDNRSDAKTAAVAYLNKYLIKVLLEGRNGFWWMSETLKHPKRGESLRKTISSKTDVTDFLSGKNVYFMEGKTTRAASVSKLWLESDSARRAFGVVFDDEYKGDDMLNLWIGYGVEPIAGDTTFFHDFLSEVITANEPDPKAAATELFKLLSWKIQNPTARPEKALVLRGSKGTGKSFLIDRYYDLLGWGHVVMTSKKDNLFGKFVDSLMNCASVCLNEAYWAGDKDAEGTFKQLVTDAALQIEIKFGANFSVENKLFIILLANAEWAVPASADERRFVVYDVGNAHRQDTAYFKAMDEQWESGGKNAVLQEMLELDLEGWHPRDISNTAGLKNQQLESRGAVEQWLNDIVDDPSLLSVEGRYTSVDDEAKKLWRDSGKNNIWAKGFNLADWENEPLVLGQVKHLYPLYKDWHESYSDRWTRLQGARKFASELKAILSYLFDEQTGELKSVRPVIKGLAASDTTAVRVIELPSRREMKEAMGF